MYKVGNKVYHNWRAAYAVSKLTRRKMRYIEPVSSVTFGSIEEAKIALGATGHYEEEVNRVVNNRTYKTTYIYFTREVGDFVAKVRCRRSKENGKEVYICESQYMTIGGDK